jgi:hypothetical protein
VNNHRPTQISHSDKRESELSRNTSDLLSGTFCTSVT